MSEYSDREAQIKALSDRKHITIKKENALNNACVLAAALTAKERSKLDMDAFIRQKFDLFKRMLEE